MNKLVEKIVPAMNEDELHALIDDHYLGESQTLTSGAEENLLKLAELRGRQTPEERARWEAIKKEFVRLRRVGGGDDDPATRLTSQLSLVSEHLEEIGDSIERAVDSGAKAARPATPAKAAPSPAPPKEPTPAPEVHLDLSPYVDKLHELLERLSAVPAAPSTPAATQEEPVAREHELISREAYLIRGTLIPLMRFMAHRFRGYRGLEDPKVRKLISRLEYIDDLDQLVEALESINVSALSNLTVEEEPEDEATP